MGLAFVLLIWIVLCGAVAVPMGAAVGYWSWRNSRDAPGPRLPRAIGAALLPMLLIATGLAWFAAYAAYCVLIRGVDPAIGDGFMVPLANGYYFCMIDTPEQAFIMKNGCDGVAAVDGVRQVGVAGDLVAGAASDATGFVLDTRTGGVTRLADSAAALAQAPAAAPLRPPDEFYASRRYGWQDGVALLLLVAAMGGLAWLWFRRFIRRVPLPRP
jgi:hypothetical protein